MFRRIFTKPLPATTKKEINKQAEINTKKNGESVRVEMRT